MKPVVSTLSVARSLPTVGGKMSSFSDSIKHIESNKRKNTVQKLVINFNIII